VNINDFDLATGVCTCMEKSDELISVVMATYHGDDEQHLITAIESILSQTYSNIELIICVDGIISNNRKLLIDGINEKDPRVSVLYLEKNRGPAYARNKGIISARGDYLAIMDSDDISVPNRLEYELNELKRTQVDIIGSSYLEFMDDTKISVIRDFPSTHQLIIRDMPYFCPMASPTVLGKMIFFKNQPYREDLRVSEDYYLWITMAKSGAILGNTMEPLLYYRRGSDFSNRRRGFKYVRGDLIAKFSALGLLPVYKQPFVAIFSLLTTVVVRLSPAFIFNMLRDIKHTLSK
jgi:glycosyltransferase involved in cell wall biosynthesis